MNSISARVSAPQKRPRRRWWKAAVAVAIVLGIGGAVSMVWLRTPAHTSAQRGARLADELGCFSCHGATGIGGQANPGSPEGLVPPLGQQASVMFYVQNRQDLRSWILHGRPARTDEPTAGAAEGAPAAMIKMPAYKAHLSAQDAGDLETYLTTQGLVGSLPVWPRAGYRIAQRLGCFSCHGEGGRRNIPNPGSFKGVIPAWDSDDFLQLVRDEQELDNWILNGTIPRFESNPAARFFLDRMAVKMPPYRDRIAPGELQAVKGYIRWLRGGALEENADAWLDNGAPATDSAIEVGRRLYGETGCGACHNAAGRGGVPNRNARIAMVPALNTMAENLGLTTAQRRARFIAAIDAWGTPMALTKGLADGDEAYAEALATYARMRQVIVQGRPAKPREPEQAPPPMHMPAWSWRSSAPRDGLSVRAVDLIMAYLISLEPEIPAADVSSGAQ